MHLEGIHSLTQIKPSKPLTKSLKTQKQETKIEKKKLPTRWQKKGHLTQRGKLGQLANNQDEDFTYLYITDKPENKSESKKKRNSGWEDVQCFSWYQWQRYQSYHREHRSWHNLITGWC